VEQAIPATPLGPAAAVAATYWVPAVDGASVGPLKLKPTGELSRSSALPDASALVAVLATPAAFDAE
jgi:hypothetical protein